MGYDLDLFEKCAGDGDARAPWHALIRHPRRTHFQHKTTHPNPDPLPPTPLPLSSPDAISRQLICSICSGVLKNPVQVNPCEHLFW